MTYPMPAPLSWCDVHLWRTRNRATEWEATQAGNTGGERERAKDKQSAEQSCKMRQDGGAASQLGRHTLPSPRQLRQRCSRVVPHPGQAQCTTPPASPPSPAAAGLLRRRSCLSDTGCRQRMMALPAGQQGHAESCVRIQRGATLPPDRQLVLQEGIYVRRAGSERAAYPPMHTWQLMKPLASQTEHLVATAICTHSGTGQ